MPYGIDDIVWDELLDATIDSLLAIGRRQGTITYGDLALRLRRDPPSVDLDPHYGAMPRLLEAVNVEVRQRDRDAPMLSALVVNADSGEPGGGFYQAAKDLGHVFDDRLVFWMEQVRLSHAWAQRKDPHPSQSRDVRPRETTADEDARTVTVTPRGAAGSPEPLVVAFRNLAPTHGDLRYPRGYADVGLALVDAIFSMNAHYTGVLRVVERYAELHRLDIVPYGDERGRPEHTLADLLRLTARPPDELAAMVFGNRARGSGRLKAELVPEAAESLLRANVNTQHDLVRQSESAYVSQKSAWTKVHGLGATTWRYFRLLNGHEDVKPDRMLQRWVQRTLGLAALPTPRRTVDELERLREGLEAAWGTAVSRRGIDQTIWYHESGRARQR